MAFVVVGGNSVKNWETLWQEKQVSLEAATAVRAQKKPYLSLGDSHSSSELFATAGLEQNAEIQLDITAVSIPESMSERYQLIWSERMLEHIDSSRFLAVFENISRMLMVNGRCRMALPICFYTPYDDRALNMLRDGNQSNCERFGHISWMTVDGYGPVTIECFGKDYPPENLLKSWQDLSKRSGLLFLPIRYYSPKGNLVVLSDLFDEETCCFSDYPEIHMNRPNSFVFDLVRRS